jgi:hypothetical protein
MMKTMRRALLLLIAVISIHLVALPAGSALATSEFRLGFATLASMIPQVAGAPVEDEWHNPATGDTLQQTTTGLMVWRKGDNWTAFTDGSRTWINGPHGLQTRLNGQRFAWEAVSPPSSAGAATAAPPPAGAATTTFPTVEAWSQLYQDQLLKDALAMAYTHAPDWRQFADRAAERQPRVQWGSLPDNVGGLTRTTVTSGGLRILIVISNRLQQEPLQVVAAVLAHETYHAATTGATRDSESCYHNEVGAFTWESHVWRNLPRPDTATSYTRFEDRLIQIVDSGRIEEFVRNSPNYQQQCS